ncbi:MAG: CHAT domain-containing protein [Burkholderiales bacterium]|nr:CHAT domain-containing protein [Burkholderiales bacterium]
MKARALAAASLALQLGAAGAAHAAEEADGRAVGPGAPVVSRSATDPWEAAARRATDAVEAERKRAEPLALAQALARRAEVRQSLGHRSDALADLREAVALLEGRDAPAGLRAALTGALGQAYFLAGDSERAEPVLAQALELARRAQAPRIEAAVQNDRGLALAADGRTTPALEAFAAAARLARAADDGLLAAQAQVNAARVLQRAGRHADSAASARAAIAVLGTLPDSRESAFQLAGAGELLRRAAGGGPAEALRGEAEASLAAAERMAERLGDARAAAYALGYRAELALDRGRRADAESLNARATFAAQASGAPEAIFLWQWQSARIADRAGRADDALAAYRRALAALAAVKADYAAELWASRESFRAEVGPAFLGFTDLLLRQAAATGDPARVRSGLEEARAVLERFKTVELEDYFRDDCVARYLARARPVEHTAARTAVIYPVPLADRLELLVSIGSEMRLFTVPVGEPALRAEALALRRLLEKRTTYQYLPHARRLYDWVIRPMEKVLADAGVDTLVFVPDQPLRSIPLGALHDGTDFVIARYALATAPSLTLVEPRPLALRSARVLASGLTEPVQGYPALPFVGIELDELGAFAAGHVLRDRTFTAENLERELRDKTFAVVHLASHARFDADSRRSFLLTYDGRMTIDRLEASMKANRFRDEPIELLFLSACQTAAGDERAALGLAGVAVKAGARSALATLWHINDQASSMLVAEFYRQLGEPGVTKAEALRRAQRKLLADLRYRHPGYWSPFLVIGNWL